MVSNTVLFSPLPYCTIFSKVMKPASHELSGISAFFGWRLFLWDFFDNSILFLIQPYKSKRHQVICKNRLSFALIFLFEHFFILIVLVFLGVIGWKLRVFRQKSNCPSIPPTFFTTRANGKTPVTSPSHQDNPSSSRLLGPWARHRKRMWNSASPKPQISWSLPPRGLT